ncbi:MAG: arginine--tRNA ligase [Verrucomicrobia bacterium]|jgi:arginyl-tRNA synthetase|nr:MAG: arginine--tRNA ligase [Verrucomicrobia bacterium 13_2_20CM_54_12]OLB44647.1 MAG: arginine--tRNA ligase [Verrucomicrobia bacterium 13_2_20CM_2_54_15]OLD74008.1 MAG: arginine--tRNA ligase [Verrucomicrobia bacterium 13_1_20CM_54_28]PYK15147.1 MAG: arginine--tRNA ligase [Verrucomicrobiota bacterium]PYL39897.1 MAG: arginine--tRNA ligase [Verrucomicrobiota bacterium]
METFQSLLAKKLSNALAAAGLPDAGELTPATDPRFGDYQTNAALVLGKQRGENPREIAEKIVGNLDVSDVCEAPVIAGPGFINFTLTPSAVAEKTADILGDERLGVAETESPRRIVIDFGSPNVAKPMHVGHIRSTVLGDALARIATFLGHEVIRDNHIGDWGTQFGMVIYGWKNLLDQRALQQNPLAEIVRIYKETNALATSDPQVREACRQELVKLQAGDKENIDIWNECVAFSMQDFEHVYELLDIHYDIQCGESFYNDQLPGVVERLLKSGIAEISEGAVVVFFRDIPELADKPCIIRKRDGGFNYATSDIATVDYRLDDLKAESVWYVVGAPQILHFKEIFEIARRQGYQADLRHITFGSILGEDRKLMKTRSGENVPLRELLEEACRRARKIIEEKNPDLSEAEKIDVAQKIGIGAVKYADLSQYRMTDYVFLWDKMLSLQGNTAPYLQNAYVRIRSIFRKAGESPVTTPLSGVREETSGRRVALTLALTNPAEINLAKRLSQFAEIVPQVLNDFRPNILANYLFEVANAFHTFYEACPVLKSEEPGRSSRLALCDLTGRVLHRGLDLLGIKVPEKM